MDYFKVVYIKELGEVEPVPHLWEQNGVLYWPPTQRQRRQYQSNSQSKPQETWTKYNCIVKATDILLFNHASKTADNYCMYSSTDQEELEVTLKRSSKINRKPNKKHEPHQEDYEFVDTHQHTNNDCETTISTAPETEDPTTPLTTPKHKEPDTTLLNIEPSIQLVCNGDSSEKFEALNAKVENMMTLFEQCK